MNWTETDRQLGSIRINNQQQDCTNRSLCYPHEVAVTSMLTIHYANRHT